MSSAARRMSSHLSLFELVSTHCIAGIKARRLCLFIPPMKQTETSHVGIFQLNFSKRSHVSLALCFQGPCNWCHFFFCCCFGGSSEVEKLTTKGKNTQLQDKIVLNILKNCYNQSNCIKLELPGNL